MPWTRRWARHVANVCALLMALAGWAIYPESRPESERSGSVIGLAEEMLDLLQWAYGWLAAIGEELGQRVVGALLARAVAAVSAAIWSGRGVGNIPTETQRGSVN
jgi:hypothetical protein